MYYMASEENLKTMQQVLNITQVDYEITGKFIPVDNLMTAIEDLLVEYHKKEEELMDLKNDIENNYETKNINPYEEYGISEKDFV